MVVTIHHDHDHDPVFRNRILPGAQLCSVREARAESRVAQWKRAGPITQRSVDRNHALLGCFVSITIRCMLRVMSKVYVPVEFMKHVRFLLPRKEERMFIILPCLHYRTLSSSILNTFLNTQIHICYRAVK